MKYSDDAQAKALTMLKAEGYPARKGAMTSVSNATGISRGCLRKWYTGARRATPDPEKLQAAELDLAKVIRTQLSVVNRAMLERIEDASYRDLVVAFGILLDKSLLLSGQPTSRLHTTISGMLEGLSESDYDSIINEARSILNLTGKEG